MNFSSNIDLSLFIDVPKPKTIEKLYSLNQNNTPEVGSLASTEELSNLIKISSLNFYILQNDEIIGFVICFRENTKYQSLNYKFFSETEDKFLYIDRVVVDSKHRRNGSASYLYKHLSYLAKLENISICCEVNTKPRNDISINFHTKHGFKDVGEQNFDEHSVVYLKK